MSEEAGQTTAGELLIHVEALGKSFETGDGTIEVLKELDFEVRAGERIAVLGQSGVGKSTLLHILGTLDHPSRGRVIFRGEDVFAKGGAELARLRNSFVGFVAAIAMVLSLGATLLPSRQGARLDPAEGLRYE